MNPSQTWGYFQLSSGEEQPGFDPCLAIRGSRPAGALAEAGARAVPWDQTARRPPAPLREGIPGTRGLLHSLCTLREEL